MFLTQAQSIIKVLVTMCMSLGFIRTEMFKQNIIISLIISVNLHESRISAYLLLASQLSNSLDPSLPLSSTKNFLLCHSDCLVFLKDTVLAKIKLD